VTDFTTLYDGTPRPKWAGACTVETVDIHVPRAASDVRRAGNVGGVYKMAKRVDALIVPVTTAGRITPDVPGRKLSGRPEDRGHVLAYSLGAPQTEDIMVTQGRASNQNIGLGGEKATLAGLSWRATEVYLMWAASIGLTSGTKYEPAPTDQIEVRSSGPGQRPDVTVAGVTETPVYRAPKDYSGPNAPKPRFTLEYSAVVNYHVGYRLDMPTTIDLTITLVSGRQRTKLATRSFDVRADFSEFDALQIQSAKKILAERVAARKAAIYRTRLRPTTLKGRLRLSLKR